MKLADDFSQECVDITADCGISGQYVTRLFASPSCSAGRAIWMR